MNQDRKSKHATQPPGGCPLPTRTGLGGFALCAAVLLALLTWTGCSDNEVRVYRVAKENTTQPLMAQGQLPAGHPDVSAPKPKLTYTTPAGWAEAKPGEFRVASFTVKGENGKQADFGIFPLPGGAGGDVANVNRWRSQVGLEALEPEELKKQAQNIEIAGQPAELYEIAGKAAGSNEPTRILGAIQHREGTAWFFKMTGDDPFVAQQKATFIEFLKALKMEASPMAGLPPSHPPIDGSSPAAATPAGSISNEGKPSWQVPAGWNEIPGGQFLIAKFSIPGEGGAQAAVNVSMSSGDGGGLLANVNRWRQQLGLSAFSEADLAKSSASIEVTGGKATLVDMSGTDARTGQPSRVIGAVVPQTGQTWFYKLMGDSKVVETQKDAFNQFLKSVKY